MKKKGEFWLGEETGKILIAVICVVGLIFLVTSIYNNYVQGKQLDVAKASLNKLISDADSGFNQSQIYNPKNWIITSYPHNYLGKSLMPDQCSNNGWGKCMCICELQIQQAGIPLVAASSGTTCDNTATAYCKQTDFSIGGFSGYNTITLTGPFPMFVKINQTTKEIALK